MNTAEDSDLLDLLGIFRRRMGLIILGFLLGGIAALLYVFLTPPVYRAKMMILVGQKSAGMVKGASSGDSVEGSAAEDDVLSTHIQLFTSRRILKAAVDKHELLKIPSIADAATEGRPVLDYIADNLHVTKGGEGVARDAHTLRATFDDPSPDDCALVLRAIFEEYDEYLDEHFNSTSSQAIELLDKLASKTGDDVKQAQLALTTSLGKSRVMWDGTQATNIHKVRLTKIESDLLDLIEEEAGIQSRLAVISDFLKSADPEKVSDFDRLALLSENEMNRLKILYDVTRGDTMSEEFKEQEPIRQENARAEYNEYLALVMKEKKLLESFSDDHPSVISIREQIKTLRQFIDSNAAKLKLAESAEAMNVGDMLETYVGLLKNDLAGLQRQREVLLKRSEEELTSAKSLEREEMEIASLKLELARQQELYKTMNDTLSELNFVRDYAGFSTDVIGDAESQNKPSWPSPVIVLALGLFAGGMFGFGLALITDLMDTTFADPDDVQRTLQAPVLAHVPRFEKLKRSRRGGPLQIDSSVRVHYEPKSPAAETFRVIRTGLMVEATSNGHQVLQVTSPLPGDGKSTTSINLAMAFAQTGKRTLIVDADLRKPRVAKLLRLESGPGFTEALAGVNEPGEVIQSTINEHLFAVGAGSIPPNPSELLQSDRFAQTLNVWRDQFDFIIVDTPPVLAVSDAAIVSDATDSILLAVRIIKNGRKAAKRAVDILRQSGSDVGAIVVNGYQTKNSSYGYTSGYDSDAYGYGYGESHKAYYREDTKALQSV
jgi:capsular exopolysaccharide synthesis family protein